MVRFAALAAALLIGAEADPSLAEGLTFGAAESGASVSSQIERASAQHALMIAQVGPTPFYPGGSLIRLFKRGGLLGGFAAGFLGAGLLGLLFGRGLFADLGSAASYIGLLFQLALWVIVGRLILTRWRRPPRAAALSPRQLADPYLRSRDDLHAGLGRHTGSNEADAKNADAVAHDGRK